MKQLFQFTRLPFGLKNAVPCFQHIIDRIIKENDCKGTYAYLDNITVGKGETQEKHDKNLQRFLDVVGKYNLTLNKSKCIFSTTCIDLLGYRITNGTLKPDPECIKPILEITVPDDLKSLRRVVGMFSIVRNYGYTPLTKYLSTQNLPPFWLHIWPNHDQCIQFQLQSFIVYSFQLLQQSI